MSVTEAAQHKIRLVKSKSNPVLAENQARGIKKNVPRVPMRLRNPVHRVSCTIHFGRIGEESLGAVFALLPKVLTKL